MSRIAKRNPLLSDHSNYTMMHVGGNNGAMDKWDDYIVKNKKVIKHRENRSQIPKSYIAPYDSMTITNDNSCCDNYTDNPNIQENVQRDAVRYDPMTDFLYKNGLIDRDNNVRYDTFYINIDSSLRNRETTFTSEKSIKLFDNPFGVFYDYNENKNIMKIYHPNNNYDNYDNSDNSYDNISIGDKITIIGVPERIIKLRTISNTFQFINGSEYLKIFYDDGSESVSDIDPNKINGGLADIDEDAFNGTITDVPWTDEDEANLFVRINGFQGESQDNPYIGNISINTLNKVHRIYLTILYQKFDNRTIYIKLNKPFVGKDPIYKFTNTYNVTLTFEYIVGLPINRLNSQYPLNYNYLQGYQTIVDLDRDTYTINLYSKPGSYSRPFGARNIYISKIISIFEGYQNPNQYSINLDKIYSDIIQIALVSTEFPNTEQLIKEGINDTFYWEYLEATNRLHSIKLFPGNYSVRDLTYELEKKVREITNNIIKFDINENTNIVIISSFKEIDLPNSIVNESNNKLYIKHSNHQLNEKDTINIIGSLDHNGIPSNIINGSHTISVLNQDMYSFELTNFNYLREKILTNGGTAFKVLVPYLFRIRCDFNNSIGKILGFRNVGKPNSITEYKSVITNRDLYENEVTNNLLFNQPINQLFNQPINQLFNQPFNQPFNQQYNKQYNQQFNQQFNQQYNHQTNNALGLYGHNYILMTCKQIQVINTMEQNVYSDVFAKILLSDKKSKTLFNTFVQTPKIFNNPICQLYRLDISFLAPDGQLYDFQGRDHSFTLKIVTINDKPKGTGISTDTGKIT